MKIGMLTQWFDPEPGPAAIPGVLAREMVRQSHDVRVLTGFPNYPSGQLFDGYWQHPRRTRWADGVQITRVPLITGHSSSGVERLINYGSFAASATVLGARALRDADALWVYNSPITVGLPMLTQSRLGRVPIFYHIQDLWPESVMQSGMVPDGRVGRAIESAIGAAVRLLESRASVIGVISPTVKEIILDRNPQIDPNRIVYAPNPTDERLFRPVSEVRAKLGIGSPERFTLMYAGAVGAAQGLDTVVEAAARAGRDAPIDLVIVGDGNARPELERRARELRAGNITFVGRVPKEAVPPLLAQASAQLVALADAEYLRYTTPSKIPSLLASENAVVGVLAGDGAELLRRSGAAVVTDPGDVDSLAHALVQLSAQPHGDLRAMALAGGRFYRENLSAERVVSTIVDAMQER